MNRSFLRWVLLCAVVALGIWLAFSFFPGSKHAIEKRMQSLAKTASITTREGELAQAINSAKLASFFTTDVQISVDVPGYSRETLSGRDQVQQAALLARSRLERFSVEFVDINIEINPDKKSATVNLTAKAKVPGEKDWVPQEMKFLLQKIEGDWLINRVETVRTLL